MSIMGHPLRSVTWPNSSYIKKIISMPTTGKLGKKFELLLKRKQLLTVIICLEAVTDMKWMRHCTNATQFKRKIKTAHWVTQRLEVKETSKRVNNCSTLSSAPTHSCLARKGIYDSLMPLPSLIVFPNEVWNSSKWINCMWLLSQFPYVLWTFPAFSGF